MAQERRFERDQFRGDDRPEDRQDWNYGRGRESWRGRSEEGDWPERSYYGRGRETGYGEFYGGGRESRFGSGAGYRTGYPGEAGERAARYRFAPYSYVYGEPERRGWRDEAWRGEPRYGYGGERYWGEERDMWDRAADEISSWFGDEQAERRRQMDKFRGRGPKNYARSEDRIREDVCDRLTDEGAVDASDIEVSVSGSEVTLSGTVPSRDQRRRAEICAERVSGVTHVQNNMRVDDQARGSFTTAGTT